MTLKEEAQKNLNILLSIGDMLEDDKAITEDQGIAMA